MLKCKTLINTYHKLFLHMQHIFCLMSTQQALGSWRYSSSRSSGRWVVPKTLNDGFQKQDFSGFGLQHFLVRVTASIDNAFHCNFQMKKNCGHSSNLECMNTFLIFKLCHYHKIFKLCHYHKSSSTSLAKQACSCLQWLSQTRKCLWLLLPLLPVPECCSKSSDIDFALKASNCLLRQP